MRVLLPDTNFSDSRHSRRIRKLLDEGKSLWLINTSDEHLGTKSVIYIHLVDERGKAFHVNLPDTYLPINLTNRVPRDVLLQSNDFWAYVNRGFLRAIPPRRAREILGHPEAKEEKERLRRRQKGARSNRKARQRVAPTGPTQYDANHPEDTGREADEDFQPPRINNRVVAICGRLEAGQINPGAAIGELRSVGKLSREDLGYIIGNGRYRNPDDGGFNDRVPNWAHDQLTERAEKLAAKRQRRAQKRGEVAPDLREGSGLKKTRKRRTRA